MLRVWGLFVSALLVSSCDDGAASDSTASDGGRWSLARPGTPSATDVDAAIEELEKLGYAGGVREAPSVVSVTVHDARSEPGLNFYVSGHAPAALLIDADGRVLHRWSHDYATLWPELDIAIGAPGRGKWRRAHLFANGDILAIHDGIGMIKLDRDSRLLWEYPGRAHHDMDVLADGTIWTLAREATIIPRVNPGVPSIDDFLVELDANGNEQQRISVLECLENGSRPDLLERMVHERDLFHSNSIEMLDGSLAARVPEFAAGHLLISMRHLDAIAVIDPDAREVVWALTGAFRSQHDPTVLDNGNLLLFDNRGRGEASTVYEFDPTTGETVWSYQGTVDQPFYSKTCGTSYRMAGGNTLITESDGGRTFEVTPEGEIVWEFFNPHRAGESDEFIACLFDLVRVPVRSLGDWVRTGEQRE